MADWYYTKDGQQQGPVSSSQLRQLAQAGELLPTDMVFKEGASQWVAASTIANLFGGASGVASKPTSNSERPARSDRDEGSLAFDDGPRDDDDDGPIRRKSKTGSGNLVVDVLLFKKMIAPWIIMGLFWLAIVGGTLIPLYGAVMLVYQLGGNGIIPAIFALAMIPVYIVGARVYAEVLILLFRMYEVMVDIKMNLKKRDKV